MRPSFFFEQMPSPFLVLALAAVATGCGEDGPSIPHAIATESAESCKSCHDNGIDNAPARHDESSGCVDCHSPTKRVTAPQIPHAVADTAEASCLACHGAGDQGAPATPHPGWPVCVNCHTAAK
jgi:DnaJ-class molecular chaperone